jgi:maltooligosyltrehalose synthase
MDPGCRANHMADGQNSMLMDVQENGRASFFLIFDIGWNHPQT